MKQEKTLAAHAEALQAAEKKAAAQLASLRTSGPAATVRERVPAGLGVCVDKGVLNRSWLRRQPSDKTMGVTRWWWWWW